MTSNEHYLDYVLSCNGNNFCLCEIFKNLCPPTAVGSCCWSQYNFLSLLSGQPTQEKQEAYRKPTAVPSFAAAFSKSRQSQPSLTVIGNLVTSQPSTLHLSNPSSSAIGNLSSSSKSSSRGRRSASSSSLSDKSAGPSQSASRTTCAPSRSWRRSDPPEPSTGLRRSQRLKETTGSCASNRSGFHIKCL